MVLPAQFHQPALVHPTKAFNQAVVPNKPLYETNKRGGEGGVSWELTATIRSQWIVP